MTLTRKIFPVILALWLLPVLASRAQNPQRFQKEIDSIVALNQSVDKRQLILFTGSSSIRMWSDLKKVFPYHNVVNLGFGGSEMADLLYFTDDLILKFKPVQVFIYEGDNDISFGRTTEDILEAADSILVQIQRNLPQTEVIFISPKPSVSRWHLRDKYVAFNKRLSAWTRGKKNVKYVDVWTPMLNEAGKVRDDIFLDDNLHLNQKGYAIWAAVIKNHLKVK
jgi:lysophospholipase L1-like esterase